jgi:CubicO group peptidase (beta-lactamase class C family)
MINLKKFATYVIATSLIGFIGYQFAFNNKANANEVGFNSASNQSKISKSTYTIRYADTNRADLKNFIHALDSFYEKQAKAGFNGSVLIGLEGKIIYERYLGYADKSTNLLLNKKTPSQLASTSKPFTATAILWLHQNKYLNIDEPVTKYIKGFPYPNITITMLLNHRSGLPDYTKMGSAIWPSKAPMYNANLINYINTKKPRLNYNPNTKFQYSNTNYALLASIIEEVTHMPYKQFMKEMIFEPLGMNSTYVYDPKDGFGINSTVSYRPNFSIFENTFQDGVYGDKGIYSTPQDMYKWDQSFYNYTLLNEKTLRMAYNGYSHESSGKKNYGLGWRILEDEKYKIIYHNGWWHGNNTVFYRFVADNFTIIILGNRYNTKIYQHPKTIYSLFAANSNIKIEWEETGSPSE